ncbi:flagellin [Pseudoalteromonas sp. S1612]|uniref:flagellin n=1 Tax=Pseudoalteromonas sp. S1612 TaxID=579507 RepID=UPI00110BC710|nr:flagellin [Pseudoalteromonas sp. S1612]TMP57308.1 flagellin [Pseudoalteromonas sp. S1612]
MLVKSSEKAQAIDLVNTNKSDALVTSTKDSANNLWKNKIVAREDQVKVLTGWAQRGALSQALAKAEQSESTIRNLYMGLEKLAQQLNTQAANTQPQPMQQQQIKVQIASLQNTANKKGSGLDTQLKITDPNRAISKQLNANIDLLSARPHEENIQLVMGRSGKSLSLKIPAYQDEKTNLTAIQNAFAPHHINVELNRENRLLFSAQKDNAAPLLEPWVMSGQGVRIAAGNPISLQLNDLDNPLNELAKIADKNATIAQHREQIQTAQRHLKANLIKIQAQKQQLQSQLEQLDSASSLANTDELLALSLGVKQHMQNPGVNSVAAIMSQANITRNMVQYSLT